MTVGGLTSELYFNYNIHTLSRKNIIVTNHKQRDYFLHISLNTK